MAKITNYTTLVENIKAAAEDDGQEFSDYIPTAIGLAEERLIKEIDLEYIDIEEEAIIAGQRLVNNPTGYRLAFDIVLKNSSDVEVDLIRTTDGFIRDYWPNPLIQGVPKYYSNYNQSQILIAPTADDNYTIVYKFRKSPEPLSTTNPTNFFMEKLPDALFYACMIEMMTFSRNYTHRS